MTEDHILYPKTTMFLLENFMLSEVRGRIPELDEIVEDFQRVAKQRLQGWNGKPGSQIPLITTKDFSSIKDPFWKEINVEIIIKAKTSRDSTVKGEFDSYETALSEGKLNRVNIALLVWWNIKESSSAILDYLGATFAHEITHAYEQWSRLKSGARNFEDPDFTASYEKGKHQEDDRLPISLIKNIVYFTQKVERNAFVAELWQSAKFLLKRKNYSSAEDLFKDLLSSKTQVGRSYQNCIKWMQASSRATFWRQADEDDALGEYGEPYEEASVNLWNSLLPVQKVTNFKQIQPKLNKLWEKSRQDFRNKVMKVAYDATETT